MFLGKVNQLGMFGNSNIDQVQTIQGHTIISRSHKDLLHLRRFQQLLGNRMLATTRTNNKKFHSKLPQ